MKDNTQLVDAQVRRFLAHRLDLPQRPAWSRTKIAEYLKSQNMMGSRKATISVWEKRLCYYVKDFRDQIPKDEDGNPIEGYPLSQYQFAVLVRLSYVLTHLQPFIQGSEYLPLIQQTVKNRQVQRLYLSHDAS